MTSTVYIAKNVYGGDGLGRLGDGRVVFVEGAWAGESVKAEIVEEKKHFVRAKLVEVEDASPDRQEPDATASIPGCVYSGVTYEAESRAKEQQLKDFLERARLAFDVSKVETVGRDLATKLAKEGYRNKVVYHFEKQKGKWVIGYRAEPSHAVVDITRDPLAVPAINAKLDEIRRAVLTLLTTGPEAVRRATAQKGNLTIRWSERTGVKWWLGDAPKDVVLKETTCGKVFEVPAGGFYQVNPAMGDELVKAVVAAYRKDAAVAPNVLDLYCGVGVFGLCCEAPRLTGIESGREAIDFAKRNAVAQKREARFFAEQVGRNLRQIKIGGGTTAIVDPPRSGMEPNVPKWLAESSAPRVFYVSCDPATLTRDLKTLSSRYAIEEVKWFDMFPRTARFETFVALRRKTGGN